ncbi:type VI secretion system protein TssL [Mesorhizobium sp. M4B.F.Ca.ET.215.01.1.1]|uniref:type VI secretion system protein TssL, long form n=1 Tax=Mesorhizobium TaxID=68287 RepID=UPI000FCC34AE|nr:MULTISPECIES: type VI secretion system protein TssL, long form [Mesorhizobium]MDX8436829.1 type VI secretion system protein TssL, long form [Mesorhizobium abyssinicae]RUW25684.1 type VI secretion system protein TssL [Mesorhizobium sp. M4B.F.Ca.ET.013.02.1.1]RUW78020.1 type VI secretion system protein TssL [Mesorhizobium sp. M4B.F.Ca.ET.049.02.1.2]RVD39662.1 type VI secretion system protein TssL [Mesorhizobium sp. M4B.F.Ca.ET.019.03.1.1]RWA58021.1 MAG: type VI secretion system protein TssL [
MSRDDPFGLSEDRERTRIRLTGAQMPRPTAPMLTGVPIKRSRTHPNALINAFAPLLEFAPELESALAPENPETLRTRLLEELVRARDAAMTSGSSLERADQAAWVVAALLDDLALNTPWGGASAWPRQPLVVMLRGDVDAGTQFFTRLDELERHPNRDRELLELQYQCLALGFRGKYRVPGRSGDRSLNAVRVAAARFLRDADAEGAPLSPHWKGVIASDEPQRFIVPIWVMALAAAVIATVVHIGLSMGLSSQAVELSALVRALPPPARADITRAAPKVDAPAPPEPEPVDFALLPEFKAEAPDDLRGALSGTESVSLAKLVIQASNPELFQSSRPTLTPGFEPLVESIAKVILANQELIGNITVVGHTDNVRLQRSNPLSTNQRLSEARAETIADLLVRAGVPQERIHSEGRAETDPVADNSTREGRALNRRVEVLVEKRL